MRRPALQPDWPASWKLSHAYDELENHGSEKDLGYSYAYGERVRHTLAAIRNVAPRGGRVLDIAAAQGNFSLRLAEAGYDVTSNDLRVELADYVRLKHERGTIQFAAGNIFDLQFADPFDLVLLAEVIEHVAHPDELLRHVATLVRPGGAIVLTTPNGGYFRNRLPRFGSLADSTALEARQFQPDADGHLYLMHDDDIRTLAAAAGLIVEHVVLFSTPLTSGWFGTHRLLPILPAGVVAGTESLASYLPRTVKRRVMTNLVAVLRRPT